MFLLLEAQFLHIGSSHALHSMRDLLLRPFLPLELRHTIIDGNLKKWSMGYLLVDKLLFGFLFRFLVAMAVFHMAHVLCCKGMGTSGISVSGLKMCWHFGQRSWLYSNIFPLCFLGFEFILLSILDVRDYIV